MSSSFNPFKTDGGGGAAAAPAPPPPPPPPGPPVIQYATPLPEEPLPPGVSSAPFSGGAHVLHGLSHGVDSCRSVRKSMKLIFRALGSSYLITSLAIIVPPIVACIIQAGSMLPSDPNFYFLFVVLGTMPGITAVILSFTILAGALALLAVVQRMPNLLAMTIFVYDLIAHWAWVCTAMLVFTNGLGNAFYLQHLIGPCISIGVIYALCSGVMKGHRDMVWQQLEGVDVAVRAAQEETRQGAAGRAV